MISPINLCKRKFMDCAFIGMTVLLASCETKPIEPTELLTQKQTLNSLKRAGSALPWLHVDGNQIKDASGNPVTLRGLIREEMFTVTHR